MLSTTPRHRTSVFDVHGAGVAISSDDERALASIEAFLEPFSASGQTASQVTFEIATSPRPIPIDPDAEQLCDSGYFSMSRAGSRRYAVAKGFGTGEADLETAHGQIWTDGWSEGFHWGMTRLLFLPLWAMLLKTTGRFTLHAAGVARNGHAMLFPVRSGGGKSTLTMNLVKAGYDLMSDDTQFLIPDNDRIRVAPFTESINLRRGALEFFPEFEGRPVGEGGRICFDPVAEGAAIVEGPIDPSVIAFPQLTGEPQTTSERIRSAEALQRLILSSFFFTDHAVLDAHLRALSMLVAQSRCYRLEVGTDPASLVECVQRMENDS